MTTQAVPIAPRIWILDRETWVTLDLEEVKERLSGRDCYLLVNELGEIFLETRWTIEVETDGDRYRLTWRRETPPGAESSPYREGGQQ
jgi:hypothetical protein